MFIRRKAQPSPAGPAPTGPVRFVVAGLGNPGTKYEGTRHNVGFWAIDAAAERFGCRVDRLRFRSLTGEAMVCGSRVLFLKPSTFMNLSGEAIRDAMQFYKLQPEQLLVFCDDVALDPGRIRIRRKGSDGGHNGLKNILYLLGKDTFPRARLGVGKKPHPDYDLADWVLGTFPPADRELVEQAAAHAPDIIELFVQSKLDEAMNRYNR